MPYLSTNTPFGFVETKTHDDLVEELKHKGWTIYLSGPTGTELLKPREPRPLDVIALLVGAAAIPTVNLLAGLGLILLALLDNLVFSERSHLFISRHHAEREVLEAL